MALPPTIKPSTVIPTAARFLAVKENKLATLDLPPSLASLSPLSGGCTPGFSSSSSSSGPSVSLRISFSAHPV